MNNLFNGFKGNELLENTKFLVAKCEYYISEDDGTVSTINKDLVFDLRLVSYEIHKCECCDKKIIYIFTPDNNGIYQFDLDQLNQLESLNALVKTH